MNNRLLSPMTARLSASTAGLLLALCAHAGPGAHGPNGEHLDGEGHSHAVASDAPRLEAKSEAFELVATLADDELSILIDRYATNEPVLGAQVEVESGSSKAVAKFHADHGDYAVADPAFLKALQAAGDHALVITVVAGEESDLLDGVLKVKAHDEQSHTAAAHRWQWIAGAAVVLLSAAAVWIAGRRRRLATGGAA